MLRIICVENDYGAAANIGGPVDISHKTFDVECAAVEEWLQARRLPKGSPGPSYANRSIAGVEVLPPAEATAVP